MKFLLDTHVLLWATASPEKLSFTAAKFIQNTDHQLYFSVASLWEIVIKNGLGRSDFQINPHVLRRGLLDNGYQELSINGDHVVMIGELPPLHKDPFDRILVAQTIVEGFILLTTDALVAQYPCSVQQI